MVVVGAISWFITSFAASPEAVDQVSKLVLPFVKDFLPAQDKIPLYIVALAFVYTQLTKVPVYIAQANEGKGYDNKVNPMSTLC